MMLRALSPAGRLTRFAFAARSLALSAGLAVVSVLIGTFSTAVDQSSDVNAEGLDGIAILGLLLLGVLLFWIQACTYAKRLHDWGASGWHAIWILALPGALIEGPSLVQMGDLSQSGMAGVAGLLLWLALCTTEGRLGSGPVETTLARSKVTNDVAALPSPSPQSSQHDVLPPPAPSPSPAEQLPRLQRLLEAGAIDDREFKLLKDDLIGRQRHLQRDR